MAGKVATVFDLIEPDLIGTWIADRWVEWNNLRGQKVTDWLELRKYIYATSTEHTTNSKLPWSNKTTRPKLTQIRDNLSANYIASIFPKRRWLKWEGVSATDEQADKANAIRDYMSWATQQLPFKEAIRKLVYDYIDYGNCFATVEWVDESQEDIVTGLKIGYIGPRVVRISPHDFVMNPAAPSFSHSPKVWRSLVSLGEAKEMLERVSATQEDREIARQVFEYAQHIRRGAIAMPDNGIGSQDKHFQVDGFGSYLAYLNSGYVELLTFAGDIYDQNSGEFMKNRLIVVIDRHKIAINQPYPYPLSEIPIYHAGWRVRQDNLWAMGPLDNLVGLQYRLDHLENMKADLMDLVTYPPIMIKGTGVIGEFEWGPMERIYVDQDGDVEIKSPDVNALTVNLELQQIEAHMEEMAGSPKEAMGFRTPGEKTAFEVQRLENAASRIFQNKITQFEEQIVEPLLNAMLTLARENLDAAQIRIIDDENYGITSFQEITREELSANGKLKPVAARHFAEQAELIQNLTNWSQSPLGQDQSIRMHFSSVKLGEMINDALNLSEWDVYQPYVGISEQAEAQKLATTAQEQAMMETQAPSGLTPDDYSGQDLGAMMQEEPVAEGADDPEGMADGPEF